MKKSLIGLMVLVSVNAFAGKPSIPLNTEINDIYPIMSNYFENRLSEDGTYTVIKKNTMGTTYIDGVKQPNTISTDLSKAEILAEIQSRFSYTGDTLYTKCQMKSSYSFFKIKCTDYSPRQKQVRAGDDPYGSIEEAIYDISNSLYNAFTPDTRKAGEIEIKFNSRTGDIKSIKFVD